MVMLTVHHQNLDVQSAINHTIALAEKQFSVFGELERELNSLSRDPEVKRVIEKFVQGCKNLCTGNIHYRLVLFLPKGTGRWLICYEVIH